MAPLLPSTLRDRLFPLLGNHKMIPEPIFQVASTAALSFFISFAFLSLPRSSAFGLIIALVRIPAEYMRWSHLRASLITNEKNFPQDVNAEGQRNTLLGLRLDSVRRLLILISLVRQLRCSLCRVVLTLLAELDFDTFGLPSFPPFPRLLAERIFPIPFWDSFGDDTGHHSQLTL